MLDPNTRAYMQGGSGRGRVRRRRAVKKLKDARWPNGVIPYVISKNLGKFLVSPSLELKYIDVIISFIQCST